MVLYEPRYVVVEGTQILKTATTQEEAMREANNLLNNPNGKIIEVAVMVKIARCTLEATITSTEPQGDQP